MDRTTLVLLKSLAHPLRYNILRALSSGELSVSQIEVETKIGQPGLSQQLAILRRAEAVNSRRQAKAVFYRLNKLRLSEAIAAISDIAPKVEVDSDSPRDDDRLGAARFASIPKEK